MILHCSLLIVPQIHSSLVMDRVVGVCKTPFGPFISIVLLWHLWLILIEILDCAKTACVPWIRQRSFVEKPSIKQEVMADSRPFSNFLLKKRVNRGWQKVF